MSNRATESSPATVAIAVRAVNDAPRLEVAATYTTNIGQQLNVVINGSDVDAGQTLALTATNLPPGATITQTTATSWLFSWTPKFDQLGSFTLNLTLRDDAAPILGDSFLVGTFGGGAWRRAGRYDLARRDEQWLVPLDQSRPKLVASDELNLRIIRIKIKSKIHKLAS